MSSIVDNFFSKKSPYGYIILGAGFLGSVVLFSENKSNPEVKMGKKMKPTWKDIETINDKHYKSTFGHDLSERRGESVNYDIGRGVRSVNRRKKSNKNTKKRK